MTISVCLIVKNEEACLGRCLDSLRCIADEFVIVDTGSSDGTKAAAAEYEAKIFDFKWEDDFAAARNFAFSKCGCDYIYSADADEVINPDNQDKFVKLKSVLDPSIDIVQFLYTNQLEYNTTYNFDSELRPKLYKRLRHFIWEGEVHEQVRLSPVIYDSDIEIIHKPTALHSGRDFAIFQRIIKNKGGLDKRLLDMYMRELAVSGEDPDFIEAREYIEKVSDSEEDTERLRDELYVLMRVCRASSDADGFMRYSLRALALGDPTSEIAYELGEYYRGIGDKNESDIWYYNAAHETEASLDHRYHDEYPMKYIR